MADIQTDYLQESLNRAAKFEVMMHSEGWELVQAYYMNHLADLTNRMITSDQPIETFKEELQELRGINKLFISITSDLDTLNAERNKPSESPQPAEF